MNDGLSFISSDVHFTTVECVSFAFSPPVQASVLPLLHQSFGDVDLNN